MELTVGKLKEMLDGLSDDTPILVSASIESGRGHSQTDQADLFIHHYKDGEEYEFLEGEEYVTVTDVAVLSVSGDCTHDE